MNDREKTTHSEDIELDIPRLLNAIRSKLWLVVLVAVLCAALTLAATYYFVEPKYESEAMFYVNNSSILVGDSSLSISAGDITAAKDLVNSYIVILMARTTLNDVIDYAGVERSYKELQQMISAAPVNSTEIFRVTVTSPDPAEAERIANAVCYVLPRRISSMIENTSAMIVDTATVATTPSSPSYPKNTILGFMAGMLLCIVVLILHELFDNTFRAEEDITQCCKHPVLAAVPNVHTSGSGYYTRPDRPGNRKRVLSPSPESASIGANVSLSASEAYKLLRTKLQFSFADDNNCHVIGVSSALAGEGKSLTSVNLVYSLAQLDKRVLLVDCDLRHPSVYAKLNLPKTPGLSNYLTRQDSLENIVQTYRFDEHTAVHVVTSGRNPPNPVELLSSAKMKNFIHTLSDSYDYIILDLPPVGEVSDAIAVCAYTDGILLMARQDYGNRIAFTAMVRQFEFVSAKILGIVYNCTSNNRGVYGKRYYGQYGKYAGAYVSHNNASRKKSENTAVRQLQNEEQASRQDVK